MEVKPFIEKSDKPTNEKLKLVFGKTFEQYAELNEITKEYKHTWNHSKTGGWMEKIENKNKALYYLIPQNGFFKINLTIRENERITILDNPKMKEYKKMVEESRKYSEGYLIQFIIDNYKAFNQFKVFIMTIMEFRN